MSGLLHKSFAACLTLLLVLPSTLPAQEIPATRVLLAKAREQEEHATPASLDQALDYVVQARQIDPADAELQVAEVRIRAAAVLIHVSEGDKRLERYEFQEALLEYQHAAKLGRSTSIAQQDVQRVQQILAELKRDPSADPAMLLMTAIQREQHKIKQQFSAAQASPQLDVTLQGPIPRMHVNNQSSAEVFRALGKATGVRVLFDPDYLGQSLGLNQTLDFSGLTIEQAFDYVAMISKTFWRPLSRDTVIIATDDPARRSTFEDQVTKTIYLTNAPNAQEAQRIGDTVKSITDMKRLLVHPDQNALVLRGDPSRVALAEKLAQDLDKAKAEIVIDVLVLSVSKNWTRDLGLVFGLTPNNLAVTFTPRSAVGGTAGSVSSPATVPLKSLKSLTTGDFAITLPGAAVNALMQDASTKLIDKAQLRIIEGQKSTLRIGQKIPYATGSFAPGAIGSVSPLVNTQFSFLDVGLSLDVTARVHGSNEVSLHIESDHSAVADYENVGGGLTQPVITQRRRVADVRIHEGEVNLWDVVSQRQSVRASSGMPGLVNLPLIGNLFRNNHRDESEDILVHLLIPHVIRSPDIQDVDVTGFSSGNESVVHLPINESLRTLQKSEKTDTTVELQGNGVPTPPPAPAGSTTSAPAQPAPAGKSPISLRFQPTSITGPAASQLTVEILADNVGELAEGSLAVQFDMASLGLQKVDPGTLLRRDDGSSPELEFETAGSQVSLTFRRGPNETAASGTLAVLTFDARQSGNSAVRITDTRLRGRRGQELTSTPFTAEVKIQ